jgi:hypothetical protein
LTNDGDSHQHSLSATQLAGTSYSLDPTLNITSILPFYFKPTPFTVTLVLPVTGPLFGPIEYMAYFGPVILDVFKHHISLNHLLFQPPNITIWQSLLKIILQESLSLGKTGLSL